MDIRDTSVFEVSNGEASEESYQESHVFYEVFINYKNKFKQNFLNENNVSNIPIQKSFIIKPPFVTEDLRHFL